MLWQAAVFTSLQAIAHSLIALTRKQENLIGSYNWGIELRNPLYVFTGIKCMCWLLMDIFMQLNNAMLLVLTKRVVLGIVIF